MKTLVILALLCLPVSATAASWKRIGAHTGDYAIYVDLDSIQNHNRTVDVWMKQDFVKIYRRKIQENKTLMRFDCDAQTEIDLQSVSYSASGNVIHQYSQGYSTGLIPTDRVIPESVGEAIMKYVCKTDEIRN